MTQVASKDFFISYNKADRAWAEWIAWQLEAEGYSTILQAWDFRPGSNFILQMDIAAKAANRTIAVLSPNYFDAVYTQPEWAAALVQDPTGQEGKVVPVRVRECTPRGLLASIVYIDLVGLNTLAAQNTLLAGVHRSRARPSAEPSFPGTTSLAMPQAPSFPGNWPEIWNVPYRRNLFFTGREKLLESLREQLASMKATALTQVAISGLGGIGKTQTALEYAYRYGNMYRLVLWVNAATTETLLSDYIQLATLLNVPGQDNQDQQATIKAVKRWLAQQGDWLLILDNADDLEMIYEYLPSGNKMNGHMLLTTRAQAASTIAHLIDVEKMEREEGVLLLLRRARILAPDASLDQVRQQDRANAETIVDAMDGLPLALDQAGAYIEETNSRLSDYLHLFQRYRKDLLARRGRLPPGHPETVATTWSLSFQQVEQANPTAADLLRLCAFLAPDAIPEEIITEGAADLGTALEPAATNALQLNEAIEVLRRYSLIRRTAETKLLSVHRLVQAVLKDEMDTGMQQIWAERAVRAVQHVFPEVEYETWSRCERYLSHAEVCADLIVHYELAFPEAADLLYEAGQYWYDHAAYKQAEVLYQHALSISEKAEGPEHPSTAGTLHELARLYQAQSNYEQALPLYQRALSISEKVLGPEHPSTGSTLHELARLYQAQSNYEQALPLYQRALSISEKAEGPEHPSTASTLHALASLYQDQGNYEQALPLYQRALSISEKAEGPEHPSTASTLHALASLYQDQGNYEQALPLYQRALAISEQVLGPNHPNTKIVRENYARLLEEMKQ